MCVCVCVCVCVYTWGSIAVSLPLRIKEWGRVIGTPLVLTPNVMETTKDLPKADMKRQPTFQRQLRCPTFLFRAGQNFDLLFSATHCLHKFLCLPPSCFSSTTSTASTSWALPKLKSDWRLWETRAGRCLVQNNLPEWLENVLARVLLVSGNWNPFKEAQVNRRFITGCKGILQKHMYRKDSRAS